jgi:hypothetical protein
MSKVRRIFNYKEISVPETTAEFYARTSGVPP